MPSACRNSSNARLERRVLVRRGRIEIGDEGQRPLRPCGCPRTPGASAAASVRADASRPTSTFGAMTNPPETRTGVSSSAMTWLRAMSVCAIRLLGLQDVGRRGLDGLRLQGDDVLARPLRPEGRPDQALRRDPVSARPFDTRARRPTGVSVDQVATP
ncbi:MAG: hypothetical protein MZV64_12915 [Ignavibacteriales bacterium]|nr:hypothetical protein [Ignavibacteriales bacterium]